ncbi:MAG: transposase [Candidatus Thiodiazotropha lotti]|nr:transposase [Candidatus Thiodiazotropha endoloripes]MCG7992138.1 transposase [Candidatus Thiodiazotropha lotti]MCG7998643.1 transposase [Candidatus Thiodiazotropha lotti]MCW4183796.1 transposase [Candidatus Thiodiazotropha weberae]MCW4190409.1 transposase [Candidatus Thiodiazotropha weberae]
MPGQPRFYSPEVPVHIVQRGHSRSPVFLNHKYGKSRSIWEGRHKASLVQEETYFLTVMRYIELNPEREDMVELPGHYRWSSFLPQYLCRQINFIKPHQIYRALGRNKRERYDAYQKLFEGHIDKEDMKRIRESWQTGTPLGNDLFRDKVEEQLLCTAGIARCGRRIKSRSRYKKGL